MRTSWTFFLMHWARDRQRGRIPVQQVIKKLAFDTARYRLTDRGLCPGQRADINVIDLAGLRLSRPGWCATYRYGKRFLQDAHRHDAGQRPADHAGRSADGRATRPPSKDSPVVVAHGRFDKAAAGGQVNTGP